MRKILLILIILLLTICGCSSKDVNMPSEIEKIIDDENYYNKELYINYRTDYDFPFHSILYEGKCGFFIVPDNWNNKQIQAITVDSEDTARINTFYIPKSITLIRGGVSYVMNKYTKTIYYGGSKDDWSKIEFDDVGGSFDYDQFMKQVTIIYNSDFDISAGDED